LIATACLWPPAPTRDQLDETLRAEGVEMIAPHKSNRKRKTQAAQIASRARHHAIRATDGLRD